MSIVKMKKLQLAGISAEKQELLRKLQRLGCVEFRVSEAPEGYLSPVIGGPDIEALRQQQKRAQQHEHRPPAHTSSILLSHIDVTSGAIPAKSEKIIRAS